MAKLVEFPGQDVSVNPDAVASVRLIQDRQAAYVVRVSLLNGVGIEFYPQKGEPGHTLYERIVALCNEG